jgi:DNA-directed RNA polymerase subunit RPC12/RpoP
MENFSGHIQSGDKMERTTEEEKDSEPIRCKDCRSKRKAEKRSS